jgi:glucokinase
LSYNFFVAEDRFFGLYNLRAAPLRQEKTVAPTRRHLLRGPGKVARQHHACREEKGLGQEGLIMLLGIDVGGTKVAIGLVKPSGEVVGRREEPTDQSTDDSAVEQLLRLIDAYRGNYRAVGLGVPGIADCESGTVWAPNIRNWQHLPLAELLRAEAGRPLVVESDRNTAVLAETRFGSGRDKTDVVFLILGTGIGAGICSGGRLVRGRHEIAGAVGWIPVLFRKTLRHFESVAAGPAIASIAETEGIAGHLPDLAVMARNGEDRALALFGEIGETIGQVLATLVSTFNPELIVIGGGVANAWDLLEESALDTMRLWGQPIALRNVEVRRTELGGDAGILGAAAAALESQREASD